MSKMTLSFNMETERLQALQAVHGDDLTFAIDDAFNKYRSKLKYSETDSEEFLAGVEWAREQLRLCLEERNLLHLLE